MSEGEEKVKKIHGDLIKLKTVRFEKEKEDVDKFQEVFLKKIGEQKKQASRLTFHEK